MLEDDLPLRIVEAPRSLALDGTLEGLDATAVLPPLVRPGVLTDYEGYSAWEHAAIGVLDRDDLTADAALDAIAAATARVQRWNPGNGSLATHVADAFNGLAARAGSSSLPHRSVGAGERPLRMFTAAHLFGNWAAYQKGGLSGIIQDVRRALALAQVQLASGASFVDAVRAADLKLRHTGDDVHA